MCAPGNQQKEWRSGPLFTSHTQHRIILYTRQKFTFKIFQGWRNKTCLSWVQLTKIWWETGQTKVRALDNAPSDKKSPSIRLVLFLCIRLLHVHRGERLEFAPVETSRTTWIFKGRGKRRRAYIEGPRGRSALRIRWRLLRQRLWWFCSGGRWCHSWYVERGTRFPFCVKQGFALDVIFQKETVCNFCLKKNVRLFFREAWNTYFIFREMWKHRFILLETWSRPPFTTLCLKKKV